MKSVEYEINGVVLEVFENGDIYSTDHTEIRSNGRIDNRKGKKLKAEYDKYGYLKIVISHSGVRKTIPVHRVVALAFIDNKENKPTVNHINGIKDDNRVTNLEWATHKEQKLHSIAHHLCDKNIVALSKHNKEVSRPLFLYGKKYNSINEAQRKTHSDCRTIKKRGIFYG